MEGLVTESQIGDLWDNPLIYLGVKCSNGHCFANFSSRVWMELKINSKYVKEYDTFIGLSLGTLFKGTCKELLKVGGNVKSLSPIQQDAVGCFFKFKENIIKNGNHLQCLQKLNPLNADSDSETKVMETHIQSILACHLFSPLLSDGVVFVDRVCYRPCDGSNSGSDPTPKAECPCCEQPLKTENTNFGCSDLWHGRADIVIKTKSSRHIVKVATGISDESEEDGSPGEPSAKKRRVDEDSWYTLSDEQFYLQAISQTIVNSFHAVKINKNLENQLIPSFLVTSNCIFINFYNPSKDILLVQSQPMRLFDSNGLNIWAVLAVWMALHFDKFPFLFDDESYDSVSSKSGFTAWLEKFGVLEKYKNETESGFTCLSKPVTVMSKISVDAKKNQETITELKSAAD